MFWKKNKCSEECVNYSTYSSTAEAKKDDNNATLEEKLERLESNRLSRSAERENKREAKAQFAKYCEKVEGFHKNPLWHCPNTGKKCIGEKCAVWCKHDYGEIINWLWRPTLSRAFARSGEKIGLEPRYKRKYYGTTSPGCAGFGKYIPLT